MSGAKGMDTRRSSSNVILELFEDYIFLLGGLFLIFLCVRHLIGPAVCHNKSLVWLSENGSIVHKESTHCFGNFLNLVAQAAIKHVNIMINIAFQNSILITE